MTFKRELTTNLQSCCASLYPIVFHSSPANSPDAPEGRKLIESIYPKNNNYFLMDRAYEDNKTIALAKVTAFAQSFLLNKIANPPNYTINSFIDNEILSNGISFD